MDPSGCTYRVILAGPGLAFMALVRLMNALTLCPFSSWQESQSPGFGLGKGEKSLEMFEVVASRQHSQRWSKDIFSNAPGYARAGVGSAASAGMESETSLRPEVLRCEATGIRLPRPARPTLIWSTAASGPILCCFRKAVTTSFHSPMALPPSMDAFGCFEVRSRHFLSTSASRALVVAMVCSSATDSCSSSQHCLVTPLRPDLIAAMASWCMPPEQLVLPRRDRCAT